MSRYRSLDPAEIVHTLEILSRRIEERFPGAGLARLCAELLDVARHAQARAAWIARPLLALRTGAWLLVVLIIAGLVTTLVTFRMPIAGFDLADFIQVLEAGINDVVLIGVAVFFLVTLETRVKRRRALDALHELRVIAHIIDMHQLTKDPERLVTTLVDTASSPRRAMTADELSRYLDYCSEMLSLTGKIAALYVQKFPDTVAVATVNEIEDLTTGLSRKIWQKLMILHGGDPRAAGVNWFALLALLAVDLVGLILVPLGLPGLWLMVLGVLGYGWLTEFRAVGVATIGLVFALAAAGEIVEAWLGFRVARRYGGSSRAGWGALVGGLVGALVGVPVPLVGSVIGAFAGSFAGAALFEYTKTVTVGGATRAGWGAVVGRAAAAAVKVALGLVIAVIGVFAVLRS